MLITVSTTTQRIPSASTLDARWASAVSMMSVPQIGAYSFATPTTDDSWPSSVMSRSAGPLSAAPAMIGEIATTDSRRLMSAASTPGNARNGAIDTSGLDGAMTTVFAELRVSSPSADALEAPAKRTAHTATEC